MALTSEKDLPEDWSDTGLRFTIGVFRSHSSDSSHSVYFPAQDSSSDIAETPAPESTLQLRMEHERISALEQALSDLQARDESTQQKLDLLLTHILPPTRPVISPKLVPPTLPSTSPSGRPSEFDGDHSKGMEFLYSCQMYIRLRPDSFPDNQTKIVWALSYMKAGRAAKSKVNIP